MSEITLTLMGPSHYQMQSSQDFAWGDAERIAIMMLRGRTPNKILRMWTAIGTVYCISVQQSEQVHYTIYID